MQFVPLLLQIHHLLFFGILFLLRHLHDLQQSIGFLCRLCSCFLCSLVLFLQTVKGKMNN